jgi:hypothetical protein
LGAIHTEQFAHDAKFRHGLFGGSEPTVWARDRAMLEAGALRDHQDASGFRDIVRGCRLRNLKCNNSEYSRQNKSCEHRVIS